MKIDRCYLCGSTERITRDHIPPRGLFPEPRPDDLITVPCCYACNQRFSNADEMLRVFVSGAINRSRAGDQIWKGKVIPRTLGRKRQRSLTRHIIRSINRTTVSTPHGSFIAASITAPQECITPTLIRIVKGLLFRYYPDFEYHDLVFCAVPLDQFNLDVQINPVAHLLKHHASGDGVFSSWHGFANDAPRCGVWFLVFYNAVGFAVYHSTPDKWRIGS